MGAVWDASLEGTLGGGDAGDPRISFGGFPQCAGQRFKLRLRNVVGVPPIQDANVQADACIHGETLEHVAVHHCVITGPAVRRNQGVAHNCRLTPVYAVGTARDIDHDAGKALVQGNAGLAESPDTGFVAECLAERLT